MFTYLQALLLGIIQGFTEWLPISSSGHLVLAQQYFGVSVPIVFDVMLHVATLLVLFIIFRKELVQIISAFFRRDFQSKEGKFGLYVLVGTIPTGIIGLLFRDLFASFFSDVRVVAIGLLSTGFLLYLTRFANGTRELTLVDAIFIGVIQGIAIMPGVSRSGSTIAVGMLLLIARADVARFSFLLSIPAILGASILEFEHIVSVPWKPLLIAMGAAFVCGYLSLRFLLGLIEQGKFYLFSYYCFALGALVLVVRLI